MIKLDPRKGFVPPKGYKPRAEAHIDEFDQDERIYGPLFKQLCEIVKKRKDNDISDI